MAERQLFAAMIANQDDDGRLKGHPAYLRSIAFPYDELTTEEVAKMRDRIAEVNPNVIVYHNAGEDYVQLKRHKRYQKPRYYHPSKLSPPPGWPFEEDESGNPTVTKEPPNGCQAVTKQHTEDRVGLGKGLDLDKGKGRDRVRGAHPSPSPPTNSQQQISERLFHCHEKGWGKLPDARISAQLRDLSSELSIIGCPLDRIDEAFKEAAVNNKYSVSYVRKILFAWLGAGRGPPR